jgi:hypothetical protein
LLEEVVLAVAVILEEVVLAVIELILDFHQLLDLIPSLLAQVVRADLI